MHWGLKSKSHRLAGHGGFEPANVILKGAFWKAAARSNQELLATAENSRQSHIFAHKVLDFRCKQSVTVGAL
jgi:hypothetical protein